MADFYSEMAQMARDLLAPTSQNGLGQGQITLTRTTPGAPNPATPWEPTAPTVTTVSIKGAVRGVDAKLVGTDFGGTVIVASDRVAICEAPSMTYTSGDVLAVDGRAVHILAVENIPAAGVVSAVKFTIRG